MSFDWQCQPGAERWVHSLIEGFKERNPYILDFEEQLHQKSSTRLFDWIDHLTIKTSPSVEVELETHGFIQELAMPSYRLFSHPGAKLPSILIMEEKGRDPEGISLKVESIADFLMVTRFQRCIEGSPLSPYRRAIINKEKGIAFEVVERRSSRTLEPIYQSDNELFNILNSLERLQTRNRSSMEETLTLIEELVSLHGPHPTAWAVLEIERKYWQARNRAAQFQKNRQDTLGMGWANHDHHTFRSSRTQFVSLVRLFETLGFTCRERFYAGTQAGWGAQIMENLTCGLIVFLDVDLTPDELEIDFAHHPLSERKELGTVGLWCALHGDSILEAGMHHMEAQFSFDKLKEDLALYNVSMMDPFSSFAYLKQAFTQGETWPVDPARLNQLLKQGSITAAQADHFLLHGALGSHLENLQRGEGYKGFNKDNVSLIIQRTDPRLQSFK
jgi:hypothetical protein